MHRSVRSRYISTPSNVKIYLERVLVSCLAAAPSCGAGCRPAEPGPRRADENGSRSRSHVCGRCRSTTAEVDMAKLIYSAIASLDGYVEDEQGGFEWAAPDEEVHAFVNDLERPIGTYLYGRRMYETMVY